MKYGIRCSAVVGIALVGMSVGCASTRQLVPFPDQSKHVENPSRARVYVVRPALLGTAISMSVTDGDTLIGATGPGGYLCWEREPGNMELVGKAENTSKLSVPVQEGNVYFVQQHLRIGILYGRNKLSLLTEEEGRKKVAKCKAPRVK